MVDKLTEPVCLRPRGLQRVYYQPASLTRIDRIEVVGGTESLIVTSIRVQGVEQLEQWVLGPLLATHGPRYDVMQSYAQACVELVNLSMARGLDAFRLRFVGKQLCHQP